MSCISLGECVGEGEDGRCAVDHGHNIKGVLLHAVFPSYVIGIKWLVLCENLSYLPLII